MMKKGEKLILSSEYLFYNPFLSPVILNIIHSSRPLCITFVKGFWPRWEHFFRVFVSCFLRFLNPIRNCITQINISLIKFTIKTIWIRILGINEVKRQQNILERVMIQHVSSNALRKLLVYTIPLKKLLLAGDKRNSVWFIVSFE